MDLVDKVSNIERLGEGAFLIEFDNGFALAYEQAVETPIVRKTRFTHLEKGTYTRELGEHFLRCKLLTDYDFGRELASPEVGLENGTRDYSRVSGLMGEGMRSYVLGRESLFEQFKTRGEKLYNQIVEPLGIKDTHYREWSEYAEACLISFGWPIVFPLYLIQTRNTPSNGTSDGLGMLFAPLFIPYLIKELFIPTEFKSTAKKIKNRKLLSKNDKNGENVALIFSSYSDLKSPKRFISLDLALRDGTYLNDYGRASFNEDEYQKAKWFMKADEFLLGEISVLRKKEERRKEEIEDFKALIIETDHVLFLQRIAENSSLDKI